MKKKSNDRRKKTPSTVTQLAAAMQALDLYDGENTCDLQRNREMKCFCGVTAKKVTPRQPNSCPS